MSTLNRRYVLENFVMHFWDWDFARRNELKELTTFSLEVILADLEYTI
jgi:hypothetical protein